MKSVTSMKVLVRCAAALSALFVMSSCLQEERSPEEFLVPSLAEVECSEESFRLSSKVPAGSEKLVYSCGFYLGTSKDMADARQIEGKLSANAFSADFPERAYGTTYYLCAYVTNGRETEIRSDVRTFVLETLDRYVEFGAPVMLSYDMASKHVELTLETEIFAGVKVSETGLCYGETENPTLDGLYKVGTINSSGKLEVSMNDIVDDVKYWLRPYVKDGDYLAYGQTTEFLIPAVPVVETGVVEEVTSEGALLTAEVKKGADIQERGFVWTEGEAEAADMKNKVIVEGTIGEYTYALTELEANRKYSYCAYTVNPTGTYYGAVKSFTTKLGYPSVSSAVVSSVTSTSATFSSTVRSHGGETVSEVGFYYSTDAEVPVETAVKVNQPYTQDAFSAEVTELQVNSKYYVKSYAKNSVGTAYSDVAEFSTSVSAPSVKTIKFSDVTSTSAMLYGAVVSDNGSAVTERGFVWLQGDATPTVESSHKLKAEGETGEYSAELTDLDPNRKYSFRAYATNSKGTSYGELMMFVTVAGMPTLSATTISGITGSSARFTCTVTSHGGSTVTEVGFYYDTSEDVDASSMKVSTAYSTDSFTLTADNLELGTEYYVRAFARNGAGEYLNDAAIFKTTSSAPKVITSEASEITSSSALISGEVVSDNGEQITDRGFVWRKGTGMPTTSDEKVTVLGGEGAFSVTLQDLEPNQSYSFRAYAVNTMGISYGETSTFKTTVGVPVVEFLSNSRLSNTSAVLYGKVVSHGGETVSQVGFLYGTTSDLSDAERVSGSYTSDSFSFRLNDLALDTEYFVQPFATNSVGTGYGAVSSFRTYTQSTDAVNLAVEQAANSYIVSGYGAYSFPAVKGNSNEPIDSLDTVEVLWESFGTTEKPTEGALIESVFLEDNTVYINTAADFREGNAVVAAKAVDGRILWSWHIWMTDQPQEHVYPNNAGTMMDRHLGATSVTPGDVASFGLLYQWGRKDPFLGAADDENFSRAGSTIDWPAAVLPMNGVTPEYSVKYPTTFFMSSGYPGNWMSEHDNTLWDSTKTKYDPCPPGWRVPDGGDKTGFWQIAGSTVQYDKTNYGMSFLGYDFQAWYPATGWIAKEDNTVRSTASRGNCWTLIPSGDEARFMMFDMTGVFTNTTYYDCKADGFSVRCQKEGTGGGSGENPRPDADGNYYLVGTFNAWVTGDPAYRLSVEGDWEVFRGFLSSGVELKFCGVDWSSGYDRGGYWEGVNMPTGMITGGPNIDVPVGIYDIYIDPAGTVAYFMQAGEVPDSGGSGQDDFPIDGAVSLADEGSANCYIVSSAGTYCFPAYKGNSWQSVGSVAAVEVLWESFGTESEPQKGDLIEGVTYGSKGTGEDWIYFKTSDLIYYPTGNAVIAAKDESGKILWSWHIWLTGSPKEQVYANNAGTMMDRNLGATSDAKGDGTSLGLLYQWGRKDPFLGSSSVFYAAQPPSTIDWPAAVGADYETGTIDYSVQHPTTFISQGQYNNDWLYTGSSNVDYSRWQSQKTIYDPCPAGWRVPDGGPDGVWAKAGIVFDGSYDSSYCGITFENNGLSLWYPSAGDRAFSSGALQSQNSYGNYWSVTPEGSGVYRFSFNSSGMQNTNSDNYPAWGFSVRCFKEGSGSGSGSTAPDIEDGTIDGPYKVTLAQFLNMSESSDIWYELTGEIINIENRDYGNFTIKDATGQVYIYGLTAQWSSSNDKSFSQLGLELGDIVTLGSIRTSYSGEPQGGGPAFYISHVAGTGPDEPEQTGPFDSNVSWQIVDSSYEDATSVINGQADVKTLKLGTSSRPGSATVTLPAGASSLSFYGVAWARRTGNLVINDASGNEIRTFSFASNDGATGNPPYTITVTDTDHYEIDLSTFTSSPLPSDLTLTFSTTADATRVILWGIQAK